MTTTPWVLLGMLLLSLTTLFIQKWRWPNGIMILMVISTLWFPSTTTMMTFLVCQLICTLKSSTTQPFFLITYGLTLVITGAIFSDWVPVIMVTTTAFFFPVICYAWVKGSRHISLMIQVLILLLMGFAWLLELNTVWFTALAALFAAHLTFNQLSNPSINSDETINNDLMWSELLELSQANERQRIYQNIHDEVGAELLQLIYQLEGHQAQSQAKSIMRKVRLAVADTAHFSVAFPELFAEISSEVELRLRYASIQMSTHSLITDEKVLDTQLPVSLFRMIREIVSNIIKHANASQVEFTATWTPDQKCITISDNGAGLSPQYNTGKGLKSIKKRAKKMGAEVIWQTVKSGGTLVKIQW